MKISWIKKDGDQKNFKYAERIGLNVINLKNPDEIDSKLSYLINSKYDVIIVSDEIAGFSEDIIKKYKNSENINIIIAKRK